MELRKLIAEGHQPAILDVRTGREFARGHVPGAIHAPFQRIGATVPKLPFGPDGLVVVYCKYGPRAWIVGASLRLRGFRRVTYLKGHWAAWRRAGLPVDRR
jgi:rhodanese-related sulfurtransferase